MKLLNLDSGDEAATPNKKKSKWLKIGIGLSALVLIPTIGSTLAGSITINAGSGVEFGQGVVNTAACDPDISLAPSSTLTTDSVPVFEILRIQLSNIDSLCDGKTFRITAYDSSGTAVMLCSISATDYADIVFNSASGSNTACGVIYDFVGGDGFDFDPSDSVLAGDVATITIESLDTPTT
jgi:hypothetical protein